MKISKIGLLLFLIFGVSKNYAQERTILNLDEAIKMALSNSNEAKLANAKTDTKKLEAQASKNSQYPDFKISGQYLRLTNANVEMNSNSSNNAASMPAVNQLMLAQANMNLPLFSGFKIQNSIALTENLYQAETLKSAQTKEEIAMKVVEYYANLFRAQKAVDLMTENLKSAKQRVADFKNLEKNGIIARNDLLKAQLQESKVQLALDETNKNVKVINYYLTTLLQLPDNYNIGIDMNQFGNDLKLELIDNESLAFKNRKDLAAMFFIEKANQNSIKIAKGSYFPAVTFVAGYTALNLQNVIKVTNALNFGLGFSYNLASVFKNGTEVKIAESKAKEAQESKTILTEKIKVQVQQANENFKLANKQNVVFEQAIQVATENYRIVKDKYDNGLATTNELLEADVEQLNAKINFAYSKANVMLKYYEMQESSGLLTTSLTLSKK